MSAPLVAQLASVNLGSTKEVYTSEKFGNDETGDGTESKPYKTAAQAVKVAEEEPWPTIYIDGKEDGKKYDLIPKSQLKKVVKLYEQKRKKETPVSKEDLEALKAKKLAKGKELQDAKKMAKSKETPNAKTVAKPTETPDVKTVDKPKETQDAQNVVKSKEVQATRKVVDEAQPGKSSVGNQKKSTATPAAAVAATSTTTTGGPPSKSTLPRRVPTTSQSRVQTLFDHLPKGVDPRRLFEEPSGIKIKGIDSVFITLGLMYSHGQLHGSNNRVIALINVVRSFIDSYSTPAEKDFIKEFPHSLGENLEFLRKCRPFAVAMNNTVEFINGKLGDIEVQDGKSENEIKKELSEALQEFREERIDKATEAIVEKAKGKIVTDDVVLVFGSSNLVGEVIAKASCKTSFSIVVVDGRPYATERRAKGLDIITRLDHKLIRHVKYTSITGLSNVIRSVTKVILGAHGLLTNGGVLAHAGTSQIALMASANNIPVLVCCETLKFCDKSPTDSFFLNEIGTGFGLSKKITESVIAADCEPFLVTPVIKYDVTPPELVTAVITDVDILPCTSVPVVLRVQENRTTKLYTSHVQPPVATRAH